MSRSKVVVAPYFLFYVILVMRPSSDTNLVSLELQFFINCYRGKCLHIIKTFLTVIEILSQPTQKTEVEFSRGRGGGGGKGRGHV